MQKHEAASNPFFPPQQSALTLPSQMPCLFQYHSLGFSIHAKKKRKITKSDSRGKSNLMSQTVCSLISFSEKVAVILAREKEAQQLHFHCSYQKKSISEGTEPPNSSSPRQALPGAEFSLAGDAPARAGPSPDMSNRNSPVPVCLQHGRNQPHQVPANR